MSEPHRIALWLLLAILSALVTCIAFRAYLGADFLLNFSSVFTC